MFNKNNKYKRIMFIPDLHIPFHHIHAFKFIKEVKKKYRPDLIVCLGDEQDIHSGSMHDHSPDLHSPSDELSMTLSALKVLYKIIPEVSVVESNHGSLFYRRAAKNGLPSRVMKSYEEILQAPKGWKWYSDMTITTNKDSNIYVCHGQSPDVLRNSKNKSMNYIQGHHHSRFEIRYWANSINLYWGVTSGCLIDHKSIAFEYGKLILDKPILGCTMVINGMPKLIPMILDKNGKWTGEVL